MSEQASHNLDAVDVSDFGQDIVPLVLNRARLQSLRNGARGFSLVIGRDQQPRISFLNDIQSNGQQLTGAESTLQSTLSNSANEQSQPLIASNNNTTTPNGERTADNRNSDQPPLDTTEMRQSLTSFYNGLSSHSKFLLPFMLLVALKLLCDYLIRISLMISIWYSLRKIKHILEIQMALKSRALVRTLFYCFAFNTFLLFTTFYFLDLLGYSEQIWSHLLLTSSKKDSSNIMEVIWNCVIMDMFIQLLAQQGKAGICLGAAVLREPQVMSVLKYIGCYDAVRSFIAPRNEFGGTSRSSISSSNNSLRNDLESGRGAPATVNLARRAHGGNNSINPTELVGDTSTTSAELFRQISFAAQDGSNTSDDVSTESIESWDYLLKLKLCKSIDIISYIYRSLLPVPLWVNFFDHGALSSFNLLTLIYIAMKFYDMSWKLKGAFDALDHMLFGKLEFGHYSTLEEYDSSCSSYDCPVCFESPRDPVTLDCKHIFCEVCIAEWLDKEKTCPVCRAEIKSASPHMAVIKTDSASSFPILV